MTSLLMTNALASACLRMLSNKNAICHTRAEGAKCVEYLFIVRWGLCDCVRDLWHFRTCTARTNIFTHNKQASHGAFYDVSTEGHTKKWGRVRMGSWPPPKLGKTRCANKWLTIHQKRHEHCVQWQGHSFFIKQGSTTTPSRPLHLERYAIPFFPPFLLFTL